MSRIANRCPLSLNPPCVSSSPSREREKQIQNAPRRRKKFDSFEIGRLFFSLFLRARARVGKRARAKVLDFFPFFLLSRHFSTNSRNSRRREKKASRTSKSAFLLEGRARAERERESDLSYFLFLVRSVELVDDDDDDGEVNKKRGRGR